MNLDVCYSPEQDRLRFSVRDNEARVDWWLSRRLLLVLVSAWLERLDAVELPTVAGVDLPRDLAFEHELALEFDAPASADSRAAAVEVLSEALVSEVSLTVQPTGCTLVLKSGERQQSINLTRKEAHAVLEMLAGKVRAAGWLSGPAWPAWLGAGGQTTVS